MVSTTGIAGLTLGGGLGWLMGKHGLAADNLIAAEVVTAAGEVVRASAEEDRDLFWGVRGGGGNFGVVSWFEYRLHPVGPVTSGLVAHPMERARDVLRFFREVTASVPDELTLYGGLLHAPDGSGVPLAVIVGVSLRLAGRGRSGNAANQGLSARPWSTPSAPRATWTRTRPSSTPGFPRGARNYWKSSFLAELSDAAIDALIAQFAVCPSPMSGLVLEHFHGAATRVGVGETAFPQRRESYNLMVVSQWLDPKDDEKNIAWARATYDALRPHMARESYANYQTDDQTQDALEHAYGPNYARLVALKNRLDPTNLFHLNNNVRPTV